MEPAFLILVGFVLLWRGGDLLVDGADAFARSHGVPPTLAGIFILGFGTSIPELAVSALAAVDGQSGIAVGNVVGSNIANVGLVLGIGAMLFAVHVNRFLLRIEIPFGLAVSLLSWFLVRDGVVDRTDGLVLLGGFALYGLFAVLTVHHRDTDEGEPPPRRPWFDLGKTVLALAAVVGGAELFKNGAVQTAEAMGISQTVIGLTLVALGTSLPELATAVAAARVKRSDLVLGNVVGSNIFNLLLVLGVSGALVDQTVEPRIGTLDVPIMIGFALAPLLLALRPGRRIGRFAGVLLVLGYAAFVALGAIG